MTTPMNRYEKALVLLLRLDGIIMLSALFPSVMPLAWMQEIHRCLGMGALPHGPLVGYLTRSLSVMYAMHGAVLLFLSLDVRRYLPVIKFVAILTILFGLGMLVLDAGLCRSAWSLRQHDERFRTDDGAVGDDQDHDGHHLLPRPRATR